MPDNDEAGHKYINLVMQALAKLETPPKSLRLLDLDFPGRQEHDDIAEYMAHHHAAELTDAEIKEQIERTDTELLELPDPDGPRPKIIIGTREDKVNAKAVAALAVDHNVYQRGNMLVRLLSQSAESCGGIRRPRAPHIDDLPRSILQERLSAVAQWVSKDDEGEETPAHPPAWSVSAIYDRGFWGAVPYLEAVIDHPMLRSDGTVLNKAGYDEESGLLLAPALPLPELLEEPTLKDAEAARDLLLDLVCDFPFKTDAHKAAWLASIITPLARFTTGPAPLFLISANAPGTGKDLLMHVNTGILSGRDATITTFTDNMDELRKRITALAIAGDRIVLFDNITNSLGGSVFDAAITATTWNDRVLGGSRMCGDLPLFITWYGTGNNVALKGDAFRRCCNVYLETHLEHPGQQREHGRLCRGCGRQDELRVQPYVRLAVQGEHQPGRAQRRPSVPVRRHADFGHVPRDGLPGHGHPLGLPGHGHLAGHHHGHDGRDRQCRPGGLRDPGSRRAGYQ
jgi:hypothetical protein